MPKETSWERYCRESFERYQAGEHAVYGLIDPRTLAVRYIGCTVYPDTRLEQHKSPARNAPTYAWVHELRSLSMKPQMVVFANIAGRSAAEQRERELIHQYHTSHPGQLLNRQVGRPPQQQQAKAS